MDTWSSYLVLAVVGGLWPASIARRKGRSLWIWWLYAAALPLIALIHAVMLAPAPRPTSDEETGYRPFSTIP